jgi:predicted small secreted protein
MIKRRTIAALGAVTVTAFTLAGCSTTASGDGGDAAELRMLVNGTSSSHRSRRPIPTSTS